MRAKKVDSNHADIAQAFRSCGCSVFSIASIGGGAPDLVVGKYDCNMLVEVKTDDGELNDLQEQFWDRWLGRIVIARDMDDVQKTVREMFHMKHERL
jgi:Holliday junction resolvase